MKKFLVYAFAIAFLFIGVGSVIDRAGATFKSDAKALEIVNRARLALGGDAALAEVRSLSISGRSTHTFKIGDTVRTEPGEMEIAMQFPDKFAQKVKIGNRSANEAVSLSETKDFVVVRNGKPLEVTAGTADGQFVTEDGKTVVVRSVKGQPIGEGLTFATKDGKTIVANVEKRIEGQATATAEVDGRKIVVSPNAETRTFKTEDGKTVVVSAVTREGEPFEFSGDGTKKIAVARAQAYPKQNEFHRLSLALLLTAPQGVDVTYSFVGESILDGAPVNIVNATVLGSVYKIYFDAGSSLPVAMSYQSHSPKVFMFKKSDMEATGDVLVKTSGETAITAQTEKLVKFSDYRSVNGVQLPYKWTTEVEGTVSDVFEVTQYEVNPANIAERFPETKTFLRVTKADAQK